MLPRGAILRGSVCSKLHLGFLICSAKYMYIVVLLIVLLLFYYNRFVLEELLYPYSTWVTNCSLLLAPWTNKICNCQKYFCMLWVQLFFWRLNDKPKKKFWYKFPVVLQNVLSSIDVLRELSDSSVRKHNYCWGRRAMFENYRCQRQGGIKVSWTIQIKVRTIFAARL